jgi:hypothetical protein
MIDDISSKQHKKNKKIKDLLRDFAVVLGDFDVPQPLTPITQVQIVYKCKFMVAKHFQTWSQIGVFICKILNSKLQEVNPSFIKFWLAVQDAGSLIFTDSITKEDITKMKSLLINVVTLAHKTFGKDRVRLPTFHTLLHICDDIEELGSPLNSMAGRFEYYHGIIRAEKDKTDHRAVAFDVAKQCDLLGVLQ